MSRLVLGLCLLASACMERTEYRYRPDYVAINQGRPLEETYYKPDGTRVVITSQVPNGKPVEPPVSGEAPKAAKSAEAGPGDVAPLQLFTPEMVLETFMAGLRSEAYDDLWTRLVSPQQKQRMGERNGQATFVKFCQDNRRELMASCMKLCERVRTGQAVVTSEGEAMTRYQLPPNDRKGFGFTLMEIDRTPEGLRLAGIR